MMKLAGDMAGYLSVASLCSCRLDNVLVPILSYVRF